MSPSPDSTPHDLPIDAGAEWQSARYDRELSPTESAALGHAGAGEADAGRLQDYERLSQLLRSLPVEPLPSDFASRLIAQLPREEIPPRPRSESPRPAEHRRFPARSLAWIAASLAGLVVLFARWQPESVTTSAIPEHSRTTDSTPAPKVASSDAPASLATRPSLASQLQDVPPEKLAIVRIRLPQRGTNSQAQDQAIGLTERAFGEQQITQSTEAQRVPEAPPVPRSLAPVAADTPAAGLRTTAGPADPMLLLVVGESEAIVNALEQLLENLEQTESEEQIQSVAQAELQQLSTELNRSLEESLANLENSWNPAGAAAGEIANRDGPRQTAPGNAPAEAIAPGASEVPSRSRGFMAWLPAGTPPKGAVPPSVESTGGPAPATAPVPRQVRTFEAKRAPELAQQPGRGVVSGRAGPLAKTQLGDPSPSKAAAISANPEVSDHEEGRRPRRVLIQIICEPAA